MQLNILMKRYVQSARDWDVLLPEPSSHALTHSSEGDDPITPADIGAVTEQEMNTAINNAIVGAIERSY